MPAVPENGVVRIASQHSVAETVAKLETMRPSNQAKQLLRLRSDA